MARPGSFPGVTGGLWIGRPTKARSLRDDEAQFAGTVAGQDIARVEREPYEHCANRHHHHLFGRLIASGGEFLRFRPEKLAGTFPVEIRRMLGWQANNKFMGRTIADEAFAKWLDQGREAPEVDRMRRLSAMRCGA